MPPIRAVVFDAYGTLLDIHAAMARHAGRPGPHWPGISATWRQKQLEYSWVRSLAGPAHHRDFWRLTQDALAWTAARHGITDQGLLDEVLMAYRHLDAFPETIPVLRHLAILGLPRAILSNGERGMLTDAVHSAGIDALLDAILSIDEVGVFKPDPRVYRMAEARLGLKGRQIAFVSSNPWDACGAHAFGFQVFWLNRAGQPPEYGMPGTVTTIADLTALPGLLA